MGVDVDKSHRRLWPWWRWLLTSLSIMALSLSLYLSWHHIVDGPMIGCGGGSPCEKVLSSRWSTIGGILPVSALAAGVYFALLTAGLFIGPSVETPLRRLAWSAMLLIVGAAAGSAIWFITLQKWIIGAFCPYCTTAHLIGITLAVLVIFQASKQYENADSTAPKRINSPSRVAALPILGVSMAVILAFFQVIIMPPPAYLEGRAQENSTAINPHAVPMVGSPDAPYVITLLFDYKCPHCQLIHFMLSEVTRRYDGKLAFVLCPSPLDIQCNPYVLQETEQFKGSCELAKVALAVWLADREVFPDFENWMFTFESGDRWQPRPLDAAVAKAVELVGREKFEAARTDPWIEQYLQDCMKLYGDTIKGGSSAIPKLIFGSRWVIPEPYTADDLIMILNESLDVPES